MKKIIQIIIGFELLSSLVFTGCKKNKEQLKMVQETNRPEWLNTQSQIPVKEVSQEQNNEPSTNGLGISDSKFEEIIRKSFVSDGNNYLIKQVLKKLRDGNEQVVISAIGGSVTEGAGPSQYTQGYAYQFKDMFIQKYAANKDKVTFIPAGLGGTPSPLGLIRYQKDVVEPVGKNPDLLIIEFAVNDWLECSNTRAIEYLVRNALQNNTAVIMLYVSATYNNQQDQIKPIADFYNLPQVSIKDGLTGSGINQEKDSKIYYSDYVHPTKDGHTYIAKCLMNLINRIDLDVPDKPYKIPAEYQNKNAFTYFSPIFRNTNDSNVVIDEGGFTQKDSQIQSYLHGGKSFPENWNKPVTETKPFSMTLTCKSLILVYKNSTSKDFGKADVFVDGKLINTFNGNESGGWNNSILNMIIDEPEAAKHTVEIKMAQGNENKSFTIVCFGYAK